MTTTGLSSNSTNQLFPTLIAFRGSPDIPFAQNSGARVVPGPGRVGGRGGEQWAIEPAHLRTFILAHPQELNLRRAAPLGVELIRLVAGQW